MYSTPTAEKSIYFAAWHGKKKSRFQKILSWLKDFTQMYQIRVRQKEDMLQMKMK